ncbi:hypothetical protein FNW02_31265 [Komarekiella sp. 'clone 1']|uniref:Uncharacterized protein n=1 Tax=Komarekiella delphini-convector SJRDD-AB1 TaxID=2593771 RepID=A0AA40T3X6_9NOST|nr:hypothetical protein [Komarekiella delphini-convector]MBD6620152.1 hypothetical protein [Komarekiella delphini-convector SJRDD-AB1]
MKYATLGKLGGELIIADEADYNDYKGFLKCPNCKEPVFLRKSHIRNEIQIPSSFVHHKAVKEVSACELRVGRYTKQDVEIISAKAKGQRLDKLRISLWKYLKHNLTISLKSWSKSAEDVKKVKLLSEVVDYGKEILEGNVEFILDNTLPRTEILLSEKDPLIAITTEAKPFFDTFLKENKSNWKLHCKVAREALELFLSSQSMKEIRQRMLCCLCHPTALQSLPELLDLDTETPEWKEKFTAYLTLQITFIFLTVDWIKIFDI